MKTSSYSYKNGNTLVKIESDGTKYRYIPDNQVPRPEYPESIDLKITNSCDIGCPMCHEEAVPNGEHAELLDVPLIRSLLPGMELAIGGGNPMTHPQLEDFLIQMQRRVILCSLTVHWKTFLEHYQTLKDWTDLNMIRGLGVSINETVPCEVMDKLEEFDNAVVHTIIGVADEPVFRQTMDRGFNILLLGYKNYGRGMIYRNQFSGDIFPRISWVKDHLDKFPSHYRAVSFDNLSVEQLELKSIMRPDAFQQVYMGEDGCFTMYVDLVKNEYAPSSVSPRKQIDSDDIRILFKNVRK